MNFIDRVALGEKLASRVEKYYRKDAIILCLHEDSLLTCLAMARQLHAWVYPLIYVPVYTSGRIPKLLGAFGLGEDFIPIPGGPADPQERGKISDQIKKAIAKQKPGAMERIKELKASYDLELDKHKMDGRDVIIVGDVITDILPLVVTQSVLKDVHAKSLTVLVGNSTPDAAKLVRISAADTEILDILSGVFYDADRYFERKDKYTTEEKHKLTRHITTYWK